MAKKSEGRALTKWEERFAKAAEAEQSTRAPQGTGLTIGTRGGVLALNREELKDNRFQGVIVARLYENAYYVGDFDEENPRAPVCFAFSDPAWKGTEKDKLMRPHENSTQKQSETCAACPQNKFGTSDRGRGKACKNIARLGFLPVDALDSAEKIASEQMAVLKTPVTSVRAYHDFENAVHSTVKRPTYGVITEVSTVRDAKTQFRLTFSVAEKIGVETMNKIGDALEARVEQAKTDLATPYQPSEEDEAPKSKRSKRAERREERAAPAKANLPKRNAKFRK